MLTNSKGTIVRIYHFGHGMQSKQKKLVFHLNMDLCTSVSVTYTLYATRHYMYYLHNLIKLDPKNSLTMEIEEKKYYFVNTEEKTPYATYYST